MSQPSPDSGFFKGFARGRFCRPQALDRPTLRNDPPFGAPRGHKEDFEGRVWREPIRKRGVLDAKRRPELSFAWVAANLTSPDSRLRRRLLAFINSKNWRQIVPRRPPRFAEPSILKRAPASPCRARHSAAKRLVVRGRPRRRGQSVAAAEKSRVRCEQAAFIAPRRRADSAARTRTRFSGQPRGRVLAADRRNCRGIVSERRLRRLEARERLGAPSGGLERDAELRLSLRVAGVERDGSAQEFDRQRDEALRRRGETTEIESPRPPPL